MEKKKTGKAIGIDIGTTSICLVGYDEKSGELPLVLRKGNKFLLGNKSFSENEFLLRNPGQAFLSEEGALESGCYMQDADEIVRKVYGLLKEAGKKGFGCEDAEVIGISSQMHGILYLDETGQAVSPFYTWKDESGKLPYRDGRSYEEWLRDKTGYPLYSGYGTVTHLVLDKSGRIPECARKMAGIGDYLALRLTQGKEPSMDVSMADSLGGFDLRTGDWDWEKLTRGGIKISYYPKIRRKTGPVGYWRQVPVCGAIGDNQASFRGAVWKPERQIGINVGTGSQVSAFSEKLEGMSGVDCRPYFDKGYLYVGASLNGGKVYERLAAFFEETVMAFTGKKVDAYETMRLLGAQKEETALRIRPLLYGVRTEEGEDGEGSVSGLTEETLHPGDVIRAYVRGMAEELYGLYQRFPAHVRKGREEIAASGNGLRRNPLLAQEIERQFGMPLRFCRIEEEAAAGAAMAALEACR